MEFQLILATLTYKDLPRTFLIHTITCSHNSIVNTHNTSYCPQEDIDLQTKEDKTFTGKSLKVWTFQWLQDNRSFWDPQSRGIEIVRLEIGGHPDAKAMHQVSIL